MDSPKFALPFCGSPSALEEIRASVESQFRDWAAQRGINAPPTASIGVVLNNQGRTSEEVVRAMDRALLLAKEKGKNCVVCLH
jgi:GGDEF domain-containing protein